MTGTPMVRSENYHVESKRKKSSACADGQKSSNFRM